MNHLERVQRKLGWVFARLRLQSFQRKMLIFADSPLLQEKTLGGGRGVRVRHIGAPGFLPNLSEGPQGGNLRVPLQRQFQGESAV